MTSADPTASDALLSTYLFLVPIEVADPTLTHVIFSPLSGTADLIDRELATRVQELAAGAQADLSKTHDRCLWDRGYLFPHREAELGQARMLYRELLRFHREVNRHTAGLIPTYRCNLRCTYCFQDRAALPTTEMDVPAVDRAFAAVDRLLAGVDPSLVDIFLYGGEPLQNRAKQRHVIEHILDETGKRGYALKAISNGVELADYFPLFQGRLKLVQVTIDGPAQVHDRRRRSRRGSFARVVQGVDRALEAGTEVSLRVNVDQGNLDAIRELVDYAGRRWGDRCPTLNLFPVRTCTNAGCGNEQLEVLRGLLKLATAPDLRRRVSLRGYQAFKSLETLLLGGAFPLNRFFRCEAQLNLWILDPAGDVYTCYEAAGLPHLAVGRYLPALELDELQLHRWRDYSSLDEEDCRRCPAAPHCGGGCAFRAFSEGGATPQAACEQMRQTYPVALQYYSPALYRLASSGSTAIGILRAEKS